MGTPVEYINKTIYQITSRFKLKHQVKFGRKNQKGDRMDAIFKYDYDSENYNSKMSLSSINLDTSDFLVLEYKPSNEETASIFLSYPHIYNFLRILKQSLNWFYSSKYDDMFIYKNDEVQFNDKYKKLVFRTDVTVGQKIFAIKPSLVERYDIYEEGVIVFLDNEYSVSLDVFELEALYNTIKNFDLYQSSVALANFVLSKDNDNLLFNVNTNFKNNKQTKEKIPKVDEFRRKRVKVKKK